MFFFYFFEACVMMRGGFAACQPRLEVNMHGGMGALAA